MGFSPSTLAFPFIPRDVWNSMLFLPFPRSDFNYAVLFSFSFFKEEYPTCFPKLSPYLLLSLSLSLSPASSYVLMPISEPESALSVLRNVESCCRQIKNMDDEKHWSSMSEKLKYSSVDHHLEERASLLLPFSWWSVHSVLQSGENPWSNSGHWAFRGTTYISHWQFLFFQHQISE